MVIKIRETHKPNIALEAALETIRRLELAKLVLDTELLKARRELAALRLIVTIYRTRDDPRVSLSTSRDEEMLESILEILNDRQIEMMTYSDAREAWLAINNKEQQRE